MSITIRDLARASGVSAATVSYVLNNGPKPVKPETRERVLKAAAELNYHPNAVARGLGLKRGLSLKRMNTIGLINQFAVWPGNQYFSAILDGILYACNAARQGTTIFAEHSWDDMSANQATYFDGRCDGFILLAAPSVHPLFEAFQRRQLPVVVIGDLLPDLDVSCIDVDNALAAEEAVSYLIDQGHRRIGMLCGDFVSASARLRLDGYRQALAKAGIAYDETLVLPGGHYARSGHERALQILQWPADRRPTALFCSNDGIALGVLDALHELKVSVPEEISVCGFDDIPSAPLAQPALTTVRQPLNRIGMRAVELLLEQITAGKPTGRKEVLPAELIIRDSVAALAE